MKNLYRNYTLLIFGITALIVQELWCMEYFFLMPSGINLPWMLLTSEYRKEGSDNGLRKFFGIFNQF